MGTQPAGAEEWPVIDDAFTLEAEPADTRASASEDPDEAAREPPTEISYEEALDATERQDPI